MELKEIEKLRLCYSGKKVLITGHTGFKGAWLTFILNYLGADIKGYSLQPKTQNDIYRVIDGDLLCDSVIGDIRDKEKLFNSILDYSPDFIFHLAAQPLVIESYKNPVETFEVNVNGTVNVLESLRKLQNPCHAIFITTDKVYQNKEWVHPYRESDRLGGYDPYSASKAICEMAISSYRSSFFNVNNYETHRKTIASARAGNVIGGGDYSENRLIPDIVKALNLDVPIVIRNPFSIRPWQHVLEPINGYLTLGMRMVSNPSTYSGEWNFGPQNTDNLTVQQIVDLSIKINGKGKLEYEDSSVQKFHEAGYLKLDINKAFDILKWSPKWTPQIAIEETFNWYFHKGDKKEFTLNQIKKYYS
jgi:CDP-glucose 4,6-dehydratase